MITYGPYMIMYGPYMIIYGPYMIIYACTTIKMHVLCPTWLSSFARNAWALAPTGGPGGEALQVSRGVWEAARRPKGGFSFQRGRGIGARNTGEDLKNCSYFFNGL